MKKDFETPDLLVNLENLQENFERLKSKFEDSHLTLEKLIQHMSDGLIFVTSSGVITLYNPAAAALIGLSQKEILNTPFSDHFDDFLFGFSMKNALISPFSYHRTILTLNETKEVEITTSYVPDKGLLILIRDRTEIFQLEKTMHHNERLKELGEMAATLAHEIRNPLGGIEGFAALLKQDLKNASQLAMVQHILDAAHILNRLVTQVLEYSRTLDLHFTYLNLVDVVEKMLATSFLKPKPKSVRFEKKRESYFIFGDAPKLTLVFQNILRNGVEAGATDLLLRLEEEGTLSIYDNGCGMSKSTLGKIFIPFFTTKTTGTGLGLAESYKVIQGHGGEILAESEEKKGSIFKIKLRSAYGN